MPSPCTLWAVKMMVRPKAALRPCPQGTKRQPLPFSLLQLLLRGADSGCASLWGSVALLRCGCALGTARGVHVGCVLCLRCPGRWELPRIPIPPPPGAPRWDGGEQCVPIPLLPPPFPHASSSLSPSPLPFSSIRDDWGGGIKEESSLGFSILPHLLCCVRGKASEGHSRALRGTPTAPCPPPPPAPAMRRARGAEQRLLPALGDGDTPDGWRGAVLPPLNVLRLLTLMGSRCHDFALGYKGNRNGSGHRHCGLGAAQVSVPRIW